MYRTCITSSSVNGSTLREHMQHLQIEPGFVGISLQNNVIALHNGRLHTQRERTKKTEALHCVWNENFLRQDKHENILLQIGYTRTHTRERGNRTWLPQQLHTLARRRRKTSAGDHLPHSLIQKLLCLCLNRSCATPEHAAWRRKRV